MEDIELLSRRLKEEVLKLVISIDILDRSLKDLIAQVYFTDDYVNRELTDLIVRVSEIERWKRDSVSSKEAEKI